MFEPKGEKRYLPGEIPEPHTAIHEAIDNEVSWVHLIWKVFRQLYAEKATVELLNRVAPTWAKIQQDALLDDVMLSLTRLTDPPETFNCENLVLDRLVPLARASGDEKIVQTVIDGIQGVKDACADLRKHRNKRLAHNDLTTSLADEGMLLPSRQIIETALSLIRNIMNAINVHFRGGPTMYKEVSSQGEADPLIACLNDGLRLRHLRRDHHRMSEAELRSLLDRRGPMEHEADDDE